MPGDDLEDLHRRLRRTRWAADYGNVGWGYDVERGWLEQMVSYWIGSYDWRLQEARINALANYRVEIDGVPVHLVYEPGKGPAPVPLVLTHGWPWTFLDMRDVIGPLSDPGAHGGDPRDAFDVIVPSLPGYGLSVPLRTTGLSVGQIADLWVTLVTEVLGYETSGAYGGDRGALVTGQLGHAYPQYLLGAFLSMPFIPGRAPGAVDPADWADDELWMPRRMAETAHQARSHVAVHSLDPKTLAYALADSPVGTAAWLWERRRAWSDCHGDVEAVFTKDDLITNACLYWLNGSMTSSMRLYADHLSRPWPLVHHRKRVIDAPTGFAVFPKELMFLPRAVAMQHPNLHRWNVMPRGGDFAPSEQPALLVEELRGFFRPLR